MEIKSTEAYDTARNCLIDTLGCGLLALRFPECTKHLGPLVPGTTVRNGARVPGTSHELDPVKAAWDIGAMIRWLDYNDTWLAAEWGHPSDNLGGILAVADYLSRCRVAEGKKPLTMRDVLTAMIKAHEIQGVLALENSFNRVGLDHVVLVKVASVAVVTRMLGGTEEQVIDALSQAFVDGQSLRTYRHSPNAGSRKSWAAGDATSRAVRLAMITMAGEMGIPGVLTAPQWGFYDVLFAKTNKDQKLKPEDQRRFSLKQPYASYVMENILFKISFPAEFHSQTACEAAVRLHPRVKDRLSDIRKIVITHPRVGDPHHLQGRPAVQPGRPRSLHPVHRRGAAGIRRPGGGDITRTASTPPIRSSTNCATRWRSSRTRATAANIWKRTNAPSPMRSRCSSRTAAAPKRSRWNIRSAIAAAVQRVSRCWNGSSWTICARAFRNNAASRSWRCAWTRRNWKRRRSMISWRCL